MHPSAPGSQFKLRVQQFVSTSYQLHLRLDHVPVGGRRWKALRNKFFCTCQEYWDLVQVAPLRVKNARSLSSRSADLERLSGGRTWLWPNHLSDAPFLQDLDCELFRQLDAGLDGFLAQPPGPMETYRRRLIRFFCQAFDQARYHQSIDVGSAPNTISVDESTSEDAESLGHVPSALQVQAEPYTLEHSVRELTSHWVEERTRMSMHPRRIFQVVVNCFWEKACSRGLSVRVLQSQVGRPLPFRLQTGMNSLLLFLRIHLS